MNNIVACRAVFTQRLTRSRGNGYPCNNRGTVGNGVFYTIRAGVIRRTTEERRGR
jgi:hypothetical protein